MVKQGSGRLWTTVHYSRAEAWDIAYLGKGEYPRGQTELSVMETNVNEEDS